MNDLNQARNHVLAQIQQACLAANQDVSQVQLLAVSKTHPSTLLKEMYATGQRAFGENYILPQLWLKSPVWLSTEPVDF